MIGAGRATTILACALLVILPAASRLSAQSPRDRSALQLFRDSLDLSRDTLALHELEAHTIAVARVRRDDALLHLRLGFLALRINALGANTHRVDDAAGEFEWATELHPDWPYPWFGLGLAETCMPDRARGFAGGFWTMLGIDRDTRAGAAFARSIQADPGFVDGLLAFAETARSQRIAAPVTAALDALRLVQASPLGWDPNLLLERGRLERLAGHPDSARVAFQRALWMSPDPAMAWLELARTLPLTTDAPVEPDGPLPVEVAYFNGATSDNPEVVAMYRRDLAPIVPDSVLAEFDQVHGAARVTWLRKFWREQAATDLRRTGARLGEHFRRWDYALRHFRLPPFRRSYEWGVEIYQSRDTDLDDRGIVWLRQGAPSTRIVWPRSQPRQAPVPAMQALIRPSPFDAVIAPPGGRRTRPASLLDSQRVRPASLIIDPPIGEVPTYGNETWRYTRPDGDLVLHFTAQDDPDDYRLVESILQLDVGTDAMIERAGDLPGLARLLGSGPATREGLAQEEWLRGKRAIALATRTSSWFRAYPVTLGGRVQWLAAGVRDGMSLVHIVYAVDAAMLRVLPFDPHTGLVPLTVRAVFLDEDGKPVASLDTVQFMHRPATDVSMVAARAELPVPSGTRRMRLNVEANRNIGAVYPLDTLMVPEVHGPVPVMSSMLLGVAGRSLPWAVAPSDTVWISAQNIYAATDTLSVFVEGFGLPPTATYSLHLALVRQRSPLSRLLGGAGEAVTLSQRLRFPGAVAEIRRAIALAGLRPGNYRLEVAIEGDGKRLVRRRVIQIRE